MPTRMIRPWMDSEAIDSLTWQQEVFFTRLITIVDDFGRYSANPKLLKSHLFPLKDGVRDTDISRDLAACERAGLIATYDAEGKPYLEIRKFNQRLRQKNAKHPTPPWGDTHATHDGHLTDNCPSMDGLKRSRSRSRREEEIEEKPKRSEAREDAPPQLAAPDGKGGEAEEHGTDEEFWAHIRRAWPDVNLKREIDAMNAYLRRKGDSRPITRRFVLAWMRKTSPEIRPPEIKPKALEGIDEADAFRWRAETYPDSIKVHPTAASFTFKEWPQSVQAEYRSYLTSLKS